MDRFELQPGYTISRVIKGGWHLAGGHGSIDEQTAIKDMYQFVKAGVTTFDCADIYTGVEDLIGKFLKQYKDAISSGDLSPIQIHTKYVPDFSALANLKKEDTTRIIDRSLLRLGVERLDLVQFAWWDYSFPNYVETALHLQELQNEGKIRYIGITNFDADHTKELLESGISIAASQVQYSLLDHRPENDIVAPTESKSIPFLCYGTVAGGFLSNHYLNTPDPSTPLENRSLVKYRLIIDEFGGYEFFQETLRKLVSIAEKHGKSISQIACQYILQKPAVAGIIVGARNINHLQSLQELDTFKLDSDDIETIQAILKNAKGPTGPVYDLERDKNGKHGSIMRYNLNEQIKDEG